MGMSLEMNTMIVTKGRELRIEEYLFELVNEGYRLYPIEIPIEVKKTMDCDSSGTALIKKVEWQKSTTTITYQLVSLNTTN